MKMCKTIVLAAAVFLLSLCVSACGNTGQAGAGSPAAKAEESDAEVSPQAPEQEPAEFQPEDVQEALEAQSDTDIEADAGLQANIDAHTDTADPKENTDLTENAATAVSAEPAEEPAEAPAAPSLLYMGQGSLRIVTGEGKVIYIDPYSGDGYDLPADLILVTHGHYDHNGLDLVQSRSEDCRIITQNEALAGGEHQSFDLGYVRVEAVEAGYNQNHDVNSCVGYVLTFSNGRSVYVTGDTSTTQQMPLLAEKEIDYAFFCCDGSLRKKRSITPFSAATVSIIWTPPRLQNARKWSPQSTISPTTPPRKTTDTTLTGMSRSSLRLIIASFLRRERKSQWNDRSGRSG